MFTHAVRFVAVDWWTWNVQRDRNGLQGGPWLVAEGAADTHEEAAAQAVQALHDARNEAAGILTQNGHRL